MSETAGVKKSVDRACDVLRDLSRDGFSDTLVLDFSKGAIRNMRRMTLENLKDHDGSAKGVKPV